MKTKKLSVKGLKVPAIFIYFRGLFDGRMKTAAIDSQTGLLVSNYVYKKIFLYSEAVKKAIISLEKDLMAVRTEAQELMMETSALEVPAGCSDLDEEGAEGYCRAESIDESCKRREKARKRAEARQRRASVSAKRMENLRRLTEIRQKLNSKELIAREEFAATADALTARLYTYSHGVLPNKPTYREYIEEIGFEPYYEEYRKAHEQLDCEITDFLNREG